MSSTTAVENPTAVSSMPTTTVQRIRKQRQRLPNPDQSVTVGSSGNDTENKNDTNNRMPIPNVSASPLPEDSVLINADRSIESPQQQAVASIPPSQQRQQSAASGLEAETVNTTTTIIPSTTEQVLAVQIHRLDSIESLYLKNGQLIKRPIVRVHVVDEDTGQPIQSSAFRRSLFPRSNTVEYAETAEFDVLLNHSTLPVWNEELVIKEKFSSLIAPKCLLLFELIDTSGGGDGGGSGIGQRVNMFHISKQQQQQQVVKPKRIAWAFLRTVSTGASQQPNTDSVARLQLYQYQKTGLFKSGGNNHFSDSGGPSEAYRSWRSDDRKKFKCSLYVTLKAKEINVAPSETDRQQLTKSKSGKIMRSTGALSKVSGTGDNKQEIAEIPWRRMMGQKCLIPDTQMLRIEAGKIGCSVVAFSSSGFYLAAACVNPSAYPLKIFDIVSGNRIVTLNGHQDIIYEICWSEDERLLMTASSDGSVRVWDIYEHRINAPKPVAVFQHPCFVYTAKFHPINSSDADETRIRVVASGAFDGLIRLWSCDKQASADQQQVIPELTPLKVVDGHENCVNSLAFSRDGGKMFSGDGVGIIKVWSVDLNNTEGDGRIERLFIKCLYSVSFDFIERVPINFIQTHMTERKILVTGRNNRVKALDLRLQRFILDIEIPGTQQQHQPPLLNPSRPGTKTAAAPNPRQTGLLRRAIFSPCGNQIYVGTDKGGLAVFNAYTGDLINELSNVSRSADGTPPTTLSYHPFDYYLAFSGVGQLQPILVYTADDNDTPDDPPLTGGNSSNAISSATAVLTQMKFQMPPPLSFNALASPVHSVAGISPLRSSAPTQYTPYPTAMSDTPGATGRRRQRIVATAVASETMRSLGGSVVAVESKEMNI